DFMLRKQDPPQSYPAIYLFQGDVYQGLQAANWDQPTIGFAQDHLAILSGLYGLLKPLDRIQPYRLEMGVHLKNSNGNTLYDFWQKTVTKTLKQQLQAQKNPILINLASSEYFKAVNPKALGYPVLTINFYEQKKEGLKMIGIHAKKARGTMAKFLMEQQIDDVAGIKDFKELGYRYSKELSTDEHLDFVRS
ncbi:MAG: peroxide stress protein YaaA, partial [Legionella sp.]